MKNDAFRLFSTFSNILKAFNAEYLENRPTSIREVEEGILPFILGTMSRVCFYLEAFSAHKEFVLVFISIIKISVKIAKLRLNDHYNQIMVSTLKTFETAPDRNAVLLDIIPTLLFNFEGSNKQNEWLERDFLKLNEYIMKAVLEEKENNIIYHWIDIIYRVIETYNSFFLALPDIGQTLTLILHKYSEIDDNKLLKRLADLINLFIGVEATIQHPVISTFVPQILELVFAKLPQIDPYKISTIVLLTANILVKF